MEESIEGQPAAGEPALWGRDVRRYAFWGATACVVLLDQATKTLVRGVLERGEAWPSDDWPVRIKHVTNSGAAWGLLQDETTFLIVMALIGMAAIYLYYRNPPYDHWTASLAIGLMLGGAAGNLLDRVRFERVTDFIDFPRFPTFNVADMAINIGVALLIIGYLLFEARKDKLPASDADG